MVRAGHGKGVFGTAYALASWHLHGLEAQVNRDLRRAVALLRESAAEGDSDGAMDLAICYETGKGVRCSQRRAFLLYLQAALAEDRKPADVTIYSRRERYEEVGRCCWYGIGVATDRRAARLWLAAADRLSVSS